MDQLKDFLRQCVKYRFWIAFGVSLILPMVGYFVGVGGIIQAKDAQEKAITSAKTDIQKYTVRGIVNDQYKPLAAQKNAVLTQDVDESWRKLRALQEPLLRWPEEVEAKFVTWGRKYPEGVDRSEVTRTLTDYAYVYPGFVSKIYSIFHPFNFEDGTGIVVAPDEKTLLRPATYSTDNPPDLSKVWAEQDRIWVLTAVLDSIARINDSVKAKDWDGAVVKQINLLEVGLPSDQDQKSISEGLTLVPSEVLVTPGAAAPATPATPGQPGQPGGAVNNAASGDEVYYLKNDSKQFKTLPIKLSVLVEQSKLPDFLVGLENSPITIQVMEAEISRPLGMITKPVAGDRSPNFGTNAGGSGGGPGKGGSDELAGGRGGGGRPGGGNMNRPSMGAGGPGPGGGGMPGNNNRTSTNKAQQRKDQEKADKAKKTDAKPKTDALTNIVEVTVYGQARFYLKPPDAPAVAPSTSSTAPAPTSAPTTPKAEAPKVETPAPPVAEPKKADEPKTETPAPKDAAPKADAPKADAPKGEPASPKS